MQKDNSVLWSQNSLWKLYVKLLKKKEYSVFEQQTNAIAYAPFPTDTNQTQLLTRPELSPCRVSAGSELQFLVS